MKRYSIHFSGYYGYDVEVEAEDEDEALIKANEVFDNVDSREFTFVPNGNDIMEI